MPILQQKWKHDRRTSLPRPLHIMFKKFKKNDIIRNIQFDLDSSGIATTTNATIQHCLFSLFFDTPINLSIINNKHVPFIQEQNQIGWRHFIRGRHSSKITQCFEYKQSSTKQHRDKPISLTICHIILKHLIECWCTYGQSRAKTPPDIHTALSTLQDLQRQSLSYSFPIRTKQWFQVDFDQISKLDAIAIDDRIKHAKTLISTAKPLICAPTPSPTTSSRHRTDRLNQ